MVVDPGRAQACPVRRRRQRYNEGPQRRALRPATCSRYLLSPVGSVGLPGQQTPDRLSGELGCEGDGEIGRREASTAMDEDTRE
jgi:hypothetical protein